MKRIYLDYASTTPVDPRVIDAMRPYFFEDFGNPSSPHAAGQSARKAVEDARSVVARTLGARPEEIVFTSGGSESNNHAIFGAARALKDRGRHIILSNIEHHSVERPARELQALGFEVSFIDVDRHGAVNPSDIRAAIRPQTILVSVMHASNEIGTIQPVEDIGRLTRERGVLFHVDAVQTAGHLPVDVNRLSCDLLSLSAHKLYGPKGVGALFIRQGTSIAPYLLGGDQERGRRASTNNVPGIAGLASALSIADEEMATQAHQQKVMRDQLVAKVLEDIAGCQLNGHPVHRLPNNAHFSFERIDGESLLASLDFNGFCASMGSACTSGALTPSHVLTAIGLSNDLALGSLRVSIGRWTTAEELDAFALQLKKSVEQLRR